MLYLMPAFSLIGAMALLFPDAAKWAVLIYAALLAASHARWS